NQSIGQYLSVHKDSFSYPPTTDASRKRLSLIGKDDEIQGFIT
ncbi:hypothetical protein AVEN_131324-1, partial [Araneus ventricosus]